MVVCDTLKHLFLPLGFIYMKFILFSPKQLALFQIYHFFLQTQTLKISKLQDGVGGVAGYINFQTKKFQIRLEFPKGYPWVWAPINFASLLCISTDIAIFTYGIAYFIGHNSLVTLN